MGQLIGQVAIICGGGSGIGKGIAKAFVDEGCSVIIAGRQAERLVKVAEDLCSGGATVVPIPTDITDEAQVMALFRQAWQRFGKLDILVNSSGAFDGGPIEDLTLKAWNTVMDACVTGPFLCTREAFKIMKPVRHGRIINIGSISAQRSRENMSPYTTAKFAIDGFTQSAALEGREYGICVSCLHPGNVRVERRANSSDLEPMMEVATIARAALLMATLPPDVNMLSAIVVPLTQKYIGRG
jgi:NAD(P)-dependent dehydrogenase (short-subunit alcohol dehydrogenase family)